MIDLDHLVNKRVALKFNGAELRFDLSHALFSSFDVDVGTRLLLKTIARDPVLATARRVLDLGCGTGILGLAIAKAFPEAEVTLCDRDSLAAAFSERNRLLNKLRGSPAWTDPSSGAQRRERGAPRVGLGLLAESRADGPYEYVLSNLPAKAGAPVLEAVFRQAGPGWQGPPLLAPGGRLAVVIVHTLADAAAGWIEAAGLRVVDTARGGMHRVFVCESASPRSGDEARAAPPPAGIRTEGGFVDFGGLDLSGYCRSEGRFSVGEARFAARGFWGLPEFDTPSFGTALAADLCERLLAGRRVAEALVVNPGVGHLALWLAKRLKTSAICGASRDMLALAATAANLAAIGGPPYRAADALRLDELPPLSQDLVCDAPDVVPGYDWIAQCWNRAEHLVRPEGSYLVVCPPTELVRMEKRRRPGWQLLGERRKRGFAAMAWRRAETPVPSGGS